jgi:hypothetical protein
MNLFQGGCDQSSTCRNAHSGEPVMVWTVFAAGVAGLLAVLAPAMVSANTLNMNVRPSIQVNTTLHVDVKPRLYQDVVLTESCVNHQKHNDQGPVPRKRCHLD